MTLLASSRYEKGCTRYISDDSPPEASDDVQCYPKQGNPTCLQEVHANCTPDKYLLLVLANSLFLLTQLTYTIILHLVMVTCCAYLCGDVICCLKLVGLGCGIQTYCVEK